MDREIERHLRWLMVLRVAVVSTLLLTVFIVELVFAPARSPVPFYFLSLCTFALSLLYGILFRWFRASRAFLLLQLFADAILITAMVYVTGGAESPFSFLYLITILAGSALLYRWGALWIAAASWVFYTCMVAVSYSAWVPLVALTPVVNAAPSPSRLLFLLVVHLLGFPLTALLASYISENLRRTRGELQMHQEAVSALRTYHENIISSITSGLVTTGMDGRINFLNGGAEQILGRDREGLLGEPFSKIFGKEGDFLPRLRGNLEESSRVRYEEWFDKAPEEKVFLGFSVSKLRDKFGHQLGFIFTFQDLTEMKALEEEVQLKQRMAAIGGIAARMAHEIRNPLASITGSVQLLKRELPMSPSQDELMRIILEESRRLDGIIRDFLMYARPAKFLPRHVDIVPIVKEAMRLLENSQEFLAGHRLETHFRPESIWTRVDPNSIRQVVWNLSRNALKAMPEGGTLRIGVEQSPDSRMKMSFEDDGIGMSGEELSSCYQPFQGGFQEGSGLGLSIVYRIVQEHSGKIQIRSGEGKGTRVEIVLPADRELPAAAEA